MKTKQTKRKRRTREEIKHDELIAEWARVWFAAATAPYEAVVWANLDEAHEVVGFDQGPAVLGASDGAIVVMKRPEIGDFTDNEDDFRNCRGEWKWGRIQREMVEAYLKESWGGSAEELEEDELER